MLYVKYAFKEVERKESDIMWPRSQHTQIKKAAAFDMMLI